MLGQPRGMVSGLVLLAALLASSAQAQVGVPSVVPSVPDSGELLVPTQVGVPSDAGNATDTAVQAAGGAAGTAGSTVSGVTGSAPPLGGGNDTQGSGNGTGNGTGGSGKQQQGGGSGGSGTGTGKGGAAGGSTSGGTSGGSASAAGDGVGGSGSAAQPTSDASKAPASGAGKAPAATDDEGGSLGAVMMLGRFAPAVPVVAYVLALVALALGGRWVMARRAERDEPKGP